MSVSWAITDKRYERQPWKRENFDGYFTDIRRAARKSLPRRPNKDLCGLLGLPLPSQRSLSPSDGIQRQNIADKLKNAPVALKPITLQEVETQEVVEQQGVGGGSSKLKSILLCNTSRTENCSQREKTVIGFSVYFAVIIFVLLIIVLVLSTTLSRSNENNNSSSEVVRTITSTTQTVTTHGSTPGSNFLTSRPRIKTSVDNISTQSTSKISSASSRTSKQSPDLTISKSVTSATKRTSETTATNKVTTSKATVVSSENETQPYSTTTTSLLSTTKSSFTRSASKSSVSDSTHQITKSSIFSKLPSTGTSTRSKSSIVSSVSDNTHQITKSTLLWTFSTSVSSSGSKSSVGPSVSGSTHEITKDTVFSTLFTSGSSTGFKSSTGSSVSGSKHAITNNTLFSSLSTVSFISNSTKHGTNSGVNKISDPTLSPTTSKVTVDPVTSQDTVSTETLSPTTSQVTVIPTLFANLTQCTSNVCLAASKTLERVDFGWNPCEKFYKFACGNWIRKQKSKEHKGEQNVPESLQAELRHDLLLDIKDLLQRPYRDDESFSAKLSRRLYQSCLESNSQIDLESDEIQELHNFVDSLGMNDNADIPSTVEEVLRDAVTMFEVSTFFKISTTPAFNENGDYVTALKLEPTSEYVQLKMYSNTVIKGEESYIYVQRLTTLLQSYITTMGSRRKRQASGEKSSNTAIDYEDLFEKVLRIYYIESNISTILENTKTTIDLQYITFQYTYANLKTEYPSFMWDAAIGTLRDDIPVQIINADYFHALDTLWKDLNKDDVKLFVFMSVLAKRVLTYARQPFRDVPNNVGDGGNQTYTEIDCVELSLNIAREEIHALYIGQYTQKVLANRLKLTDIKNKINGAFQKLLSSSAWVKQGLNIAGSTMAKNMKMNFSPLKTSVRQTSNINGEKQSFLSLALELHKQKYVSEMSRLGKKVSEISMDWTSTQVYFDAHLNAIGLPTALAIYLNEENQPFEVYSYIGMLIAQKFVRVLTGSLTGGVPPQWWGTDNTLAFTDVPQCFGQQLSKFQNMYYDIGNIMIANSAFEVIKQVYQTYSTSLNRDIPGTNIKENVLFVINTAQLFCQLKDGTHTFRLIKERINNVMMNNVDFQQMFSCPDVSSMVSNNTCSLFS